MIKRQMKFSCANYNIFYGKLMLNYEKLMFDKIKINTTYAWRHENRRLYVCSGPSTSEDTELQPNYLACFKIINLNARSILKKFVELESILLEHESDIIGITETWLCKGISDADVTLCGYTLAKRPMQ